jgi:hypothetical protein
VRSCAGAYVSGAAGSNECPAGSVRIETEAACRTAAAAAGKTVPSSFVEVAPLFPRGCYYLTGINNRAFFNIDAVGAGWSAAQLLCDARAATTGVPLQRRRRTDARRRRTDARSRVPTPRGCCAALVSGVRNARRAYRCAHMYT